MSPTVFTDARDTDAEFARIAAKMEPFSEPEPDYEPFEEDGDQVGDEDDPVIDWP
ncbi:hypothetical protein [Streptomonospora salina]|uniref:Uncharacterized protein n=1 Tax=Streptomonospora salina TaxID=104205 RepID=A0A841EHK0_9ACTN|nr:hypothetical protein [Streptomonospora salina]MBB5998901.1 hypothetical protein [Streptomonospora salina]